LLEKRSDKDSEITFIENALWS